MDDGMPRFTLAQANAILPRVIKLTEAAIAELQGAKERMESEEIFGEDDARQSYEVQAGLILEKWARDIRKLGIYPKGYFTVDFKSVIPETLLCWTYDEARVCYTHRVWENFKHRRRIDHPELYSYEFSLN